MLTCRPPANRLLLSIYLFLGLFACYGADHPVLRHENVKFFTTTFFKGKCAYSLEKQESFDWDAFTVEHAIAYKEHGFRFSSDKRYALNLQRLGLNYCEKNDHITIQRTEPDSFIDLYEIVDGKMCQISNLASIGPIGVVCNAFWASPKTIVILSIVEEVGYISLFDLQQRTKTIYRIDKKQYKKFPLDSDAFSNYYKTAYLSEYKLLFKPYEDICF